MYHYVGFLVNQGKKLTELVNWWEKNKTKQNFIKELMEEIAKTIKKCPSIDYQYKTDGSDKTKCKPILLLHNIQIIINQATVSQEQYGKAVFHRFPFHIFQEEKWDVEHINSAVTNDESDSTTQKEWLLNVFLVVSENLQDEIKNFLKDEKNREILNDLFALVRVHETERTETGSACAGLMKRKIKSKITLSWIPPPTEAMVMPSFLQSAESLSGRKGAKELRLNLKMERLRYQKQPFILPLYHPVQDRFSSNIFLPLRET